MAMIGRIDDTSKLLSENVKENQQHSSYSILCKIFWSKNVNDERDSPDQILLGAQNTSYCVLMVKSSWDKVTEMVKSGWSANEACNRIYEVCGESSSVTQIINRMRRDRRSGRYPALRMIQS